MAIILIDTIICLQPPIVLYKRERANNTRVRPIDLEQECN